MTTNVIPRTNHLIWIRYFAAIAIMLSHSRLFDTVPIEYKANMGTFTWLFPGVPILFFISGFVVSLSFKGTGNYVEYLAKRVLRIFPPLWACVLITVVALFASGYLNPMELNWPKFAFWVLGQLTFLQVYHPDFLSEFGLGVINGPLWVVPLIFQFYIVLPFLVSLDKKLSEKYGENWIYILLVVLGVMNTTFHYFHNFHESIITKLLFLTLVPWAFVFTLGYFFQRNYTKLKFKSNYAWLLFLCMHIGVFFALREIGFRWGRNDINPVLIVGLALIVLNLAFLPKSSSELFNGLQRFLSKYDISFGLFVYHVVVLNFFLEYEILVDCWPCRLVAFFAVSVVVSSVSMLFLEKPIRDNREWLLSKLLSRVVKK